MPHLLPHSGWLDRPHRDSRRGRQAFTLLEMLLVIALIGLLSGVLISGADRLLNPGPDTPVQAFWKMSAASRRYALQHECEVRLSIETTTNELLAHAADGTDLPIIKIPDGATLSLLPGVTTTSANSSTVNVFSSSATTSDGTLLPYVSYYEDGTCTLYRVQIDLGAAAAGSQPLIIEIDPWTGGPMLKTTTTSTLFPSG